MAALPRRLTIWITVYLVCSAVTVLLCGRYGGSQRAAEAVPASC